MHACCRIGRLLAASRRSCVFTASIGGQVLCRADPLVAKKKESDQIGGKCGVRIVFGKIRV